MVGSESAAAQRLQLKGGAEQAWTLQMKPDLRPRRAQHAHGGGYR